MAMDQDFRSFGTFLDYGGVSDALSKAYDFIKAKDYSSPFFIKSAPGNGRTHFLWAMVRELGGDVRKIVDVSKLNQISSLYSWLELNPCFDKYLHSHDYGLFVDEAELITSDFQDRLVYLVDMKRQMGHPVVIALDASRADFVLSLFGFYGAKFCELGLPSVGDGISILIDFAKKEGLELPSEIALRIFMQQKSPSVQNLIDVLRSFCCYCMFFGVKASADVYSCYQARFSPGDFR